MKNIVIIILASIFLISATVETTITVFKPATPKSSIVMNGQIYRNTNDVQKAINIYNLIGYQVKSSTYTTNGTYFIILEKY